MKKYKIYKDGKLILTDRFYSLKHIKKYLESKCAPGKYEVQKLSVYRDNDIKIINVKGRK